MRDKKLISLYIFFFVYFFTMGPSALVPKYYIEIGLTESQIGTLTSIPSLIAMAVMPIWGTWSDRVRYKRTIVLISMLCCGVICFFINSLTSFVPLLVALTIYSSCQQPASPTATAIALEYTNSVGKKFGPIRMTASIGYQLILLVVGAVMTTTLKGLYAIIGTACIVTAAFTFLLPPVEGHQHSRKKKIPMSALLKNPRIRWLFVMVFIGMITSMFYSSFFSAHLGQLGFSNALTSVLTFLAIVTELPMLLVIDKVMKKKSVWQWLLIGYALNGVRWLGLAFFKNPVMIILFQLPTFSAMGCFEYIPQQYISRVADEEQSGAAQSALTLVSFGIARVFGSLIGGRISEWIGIQAMFGILGVMLLVSVAAFIIPARRLGRLDKADGIWPPV